MAQFGGFWIRVVAYIIDAIVLTIASIPIGLIFGISMMAGFDPTAAANADAMAGANALANLLSLGGDWGLLNLRFTYQPADADWQVSLFGTNLTDEYTINSGFFHGIWGYDFATVGRPREAGAAINFRF